MKTQTKEQRALTDLCNAWNELAPIADLGFAQKLVSIFNDAGIKDEREQCRVVVKSLYDGLAYGNWPSVLKKSIVL